jgi:hypothetical protein
MDNASAIRIELSIDDRDLILQHVTLCYPGLKEKIQKKRSRNGMISLDVNKSELSDLIGCVAREANHTSNRKLERELDPLFEYLESVEYRSKRQGV